MVQRRGGKYRVQGWVMEGGIRVKRSFTFDRKVDAQAKEDEIRNVRQLMRAGLEMPTDDVLVFDYARNWMTKRDRSMLRSTTEMDGSRLKNYVLLAIGGFPINMVTTAMIRDLLDKAQVEHNLSNATRNRIRAVLHTMFQDAFMDEKILANPVSRAPLLKESPTRGRALTQAECEALFAECYRMTPSIGFCAVLMVWGAGIRVSNAVAVQNQDFDLVRNEIRISRLFEQVSATIREGIKGKPEGLVIPLFPRMRAAFLTHLAKTEFKRPTDYCMKNTIGTQLRTNQARVAIKKAAKAIGIPHITPHILRATFASLAEEAGYSKEDIQRMLGHSSVQVTERYTRRTAQPLVEKGERLGFGAIEGLTPVKSVLGDTRVTEGLELPKNVHNLPSRKTALKQRKE